MSRQKKISTSLLILFWALFFNIFSFQTWAQGINLYTPFTKISVSPGEVIDFQVEALNPAGTIRTADLRVYGLPEDWSYEIKSGNWTVEQLSVKPNDKQSLMFKVNVPIKVDKGTYRFRLGAGGNSLALTVVVVEQGTYKTEFSTDQKNIEGAANSTFTYNANLYNQTADNQVYSFRAQAQPGWDVAFKANHKQVSSINIEPNQRQDVQIEVTPPENTKAGTYKIPVYASNGNSNAEMELEVVVLGSYDIQLSTPSGLLSTELTAGRTKKIKLIVKNTGSSDLRNIDFRSSTPAKWEASFEPTKVQVLKSGESQEIIANIKVDKKAIAGDYVVDLEAKTAEKSSKITIRTTVETSLFVGWLGFMIILASAGLIYYFIRKYGRR